MKKITLIASKKGALKIMNQLSSFDAQLMNVSDIEPAKPVRDFSNAERVGTRNIKPSKDVAHRNPETGVAEPWTAWRDLNDSRLVTEETKTGQTRINICKTLSNLGLTEDQMLNSVWKKGSLESCVKSSYIRRTRA